VLYTCMCYYSHFLFIKSFFENIKLRVGQGQFVGAVNTTLQYLRRGRGQDEGGRRPSGCSLTPRVKCRASFLPRWLSVMACPPRVW
jgi:hypothetical protein